METCWKQLFTRPLFLAARPCATAIMYIENTRIVYVVLNVFNLQLMNSRSYKTKLMISLWNRKLADQPYLINFTFILRDHIFTWLLTSSNHLKSEIKTTVAKQKGFDSCIVVVQEACLNFREI